MSCLSLEYLNSLSEDSLNGLFSLIEVRFQEARRLKLCAPIPGQFRFLIYLNCQYLLNLIINEK